MENTFIRSFDGISKSKHLRRDIELYEKIILAFRKVGFVYIHNPYDPYSFSDIPFFLKNTTDPQHYQAIVLYSELPQDFNIIDMLAREKILQFELGVPIKIESEIDCVKINIFLSYYHIMTN